MFSRRSAAVTAIAAAALACGSLPLSTVAHAAPASAQAPLSIVTGTTAYAAPSLLRGAGTATVTFTVHNNTSRAVSFEPTVIGNTRGVIPISSNQVSRAVQAVNAPASLLVETGHDGLIADTLAPAGKPAGSEFSLPAGASYTWQLSYSVKDSFPANDPDLSLDFQALGGPLNSSLAGDGSYVDFGIAVGHSHPFAEFLTGGGTVAPGKPLLLDLNMANYTGAAVSGTFATRFASEFVGNGSGSAKRPLLALDAWENGHWVTLTSLFNGNAWNLPPFTGSIANGVNHQVALRLRVLDDNGGASTGTVALSGLTYLSNGTTGRLLSGFQSSQVAVAK